MKPPMDGGLGAAMGQPPMPEGQPQAVPQQGGDEAAPGAEALKSPEDKAAYNRMYAYSLMLLYNKQFMPRAVEALKTAQSIEATVAQIAVSIGLRLIDAAEDQGVSINTVVLTMSGAQLIYEIAELAEKKAGVKLSQEEMESAFILAAEQSQRAFGQRIADAPEPEGGGLGSNVGGMMQEIADPQAAAQILERNKQAMLPKNMRAGAQPPKPEGMV